MGELEYIEWLRGRTPAHPRVPLGPGDDCALVRLQGRELLVTTDMLMEGSHFRLADAGARRVGRKAMAVNLSDLAAMGAMPVAAVVSVALPRGAGTSELARELYLGMRELADAFDTPIAGGDTNAWAGPLVLGVTLFGEPGPQGPICRRGARAGDWLLVTGTLGGSILGKHLDFTPRVREGLELQFHAELHAMTDLSDGLASDARHLCEESGLGLVLQAEALPVSEAALQMPGDRAIERALTDGEDFELVFAVSPEEGQHLIAQQPLHSVRLTKVGEFRQEPGLYLAQGAQLLPLASAGFEHHFEH